MANDILSLLQESGYYGAGGRDPGQRDIDKISNIGSSVSGLGKSLMDYVTLREAMKKAELERQKLQQEIESNKLALTPIYKTAGLPSKEEELAKQKQIEQRNIGLQQSKNIYGGYHGIPSNLTEEEFKATTGLGGTDYSQFKQNYGQEPQQFVSEREQFAKSRNISPEILDMPVSKAKEYGSVIGTGKVWVNPSNPSQFSETPIAGWYEAKQSQGLAAAAQFAKQEKQQTFAEKQQKRAQEFETIQMKMREKMREEADNRLLGRQELQQIRPSYNDLNNQLILGDKVKKGLEYAIQNGINVTGLLSTPINKFKEVFGMMPEDKQKILTDLRLNFADFVRARGGTAFTETEKQVFSPIVPEEKVDEETNLYRINRMMDILNDKKNFYETNYPAVSKSVKPENFNKPISSPKEFASLGALQTAFKAGKITADEAKNYARQKGWAK